MNANLNFLTHIPWFFDGPEGNKNKYVIYLTETSKERHRTKIFDEHNDL